jgi:putative ABC transport system permease protein
VALWLLLTLVAILGIVALIAIRKPVFFRMSLRNALRRPSQTSMVVLGLMVGTAILSAAFVASDSMEYWIVEDIYKSEDLADEWVTANGDGTFPYSVYQDLSEDTAVRGVTDGLTPMMMLRGVSVNNVDDGQTESGIDLHGVDFETDRAFGEFVTLDGRTIDGTSLLPFEAIVSKSLASSMRIDVGDSLMVFFVPPLPANATASPTSTGQGGGTEGADGPAIHYTVLTVRNVVRDEGKADYSTGMNMFVTLGTAQTIVGTPGAINTIKVSNNGGVVAGMDLSDEAVEVLDSALARIGPSVGLEAGLFDVSADKQESVELAEESSKGFKDFLLMASIFTVISGTLLIINIFTMLAEERKKELGISRAIGMRRGSLVRTFTFEGVAYSLVAAGLGTLVGVGIGWALINGMMSSFSDVGEIPFYYKNSSLLIAFTVGTLITVTTVAYSSWRVSKLNIVRSIRSIDEPRVRSTGLKDVVKGGALLSLGLFMSVMGFAPGGSILLAVLGPNVAIIGTGISLRRWFSRDAANTLMGFGVIIYSVWSLFNLEAGEADGMIAIVIVGLMLVGGSVLALVSNSRPIVKGVGWLLSLTPRGKAVGTPAIAHPLNRGFRTGMTIAMFGLIIFIVVLFSIFFAVFTPDTEGERGGYDLLATSSVPVDDIWNVTIEGNGGVTPTVNYTTLTTDIEHVHGITEFGFWGYLYVNGEELVTYGPPYTTAFGIEEGFASYTHYRLTERSPEYGSDREAWLALTEDPNLCIMDKDTASASGDVKIGAVISVPDPIAEGVMHNYTLIGIADEFAFRGVFVQKEGLQGTFPTLRGDTLFLLTVKQGEDQGKVAKDLESDLSALGMNVLVFEDLIAEYNAAIDQMFSMFALFMALGLVVGVASLGVLAVRSVIERRTEIGIMRAIGYQRKQIMAVFSTEMLFVTIMGILIGLSTGSVSGYGIVTTSMDGLDMEFVMPWDNILMVIGLTIMAALICTFLPAYKASRMNPAEAVRWVE